MGRIVASGAAVTWAGAKRNRTNWTSISSTSTGAMISPRTSCPLLAVQLQTQAEELYAADRTFMWEIAATQVVLSPEAVQVREPNTVMVTINGPVCAALAGAYQAAGLLDT